MRVALAGWAVATAARGIIAAVATTARGVLAAAVKVVVYAAARAEAGT